MEATQSNEQPQIITPIGLFATPESQEEIQGFIDRSTDKTSCTMIYGLVWNYLAKQANENFKKVHKTANELDTMLDDIEALVNSLLNYDSNPEVYKSTVKTMHKVLAGEDLEEWEQQVIKLEKEKLK